MFSMIVSAAGGIGSILTLSCMIIKPIREKIFGLKKIEEAQKCMLRQEILSAYYNGKDSHEIRQYERENLDKIYAAYTSMGGNSFASDIYSEMRTWEVIS